MVEFGLNIMKIQDVSKCFKKVYYTSELLVLGCFFVVSVVELLYEFWNEVYGVGENYMKRIHLSDLESQYKIQQYRDLYDKVRELIALNEIKPVKAAGLNGKKPALYNEYWILSKHEDVSNYIEELSYNYVPMISTNYYLNHIQQYIEDRVWLLYLNQFLKNNRNSLQTSKSLNERSFEIWHREKFLKEEQGKKILRRCGIALEQLNIYETTEPLAYYAHTREVPQNILILENKDTFFSMRRHLLAGQNSIMGCEIGTLIYGAGKGIYRSFKDFSLCAEPYMREKNNTIYYFGDLDYEGIAICENLAVSFNEECKMIPFVQGYLEMLKKAKEIGIEKLPSMKKGQNQNGIETFFHAFSEEDVLIMQQILEAGRYIPQEILNIEDF